MGTTTGLSASRLRRMRDVLTGYVERGELPGFVALVSRHGATHVECVGYERDTIFRLASMSKPIAAAAALMLVEDGALRLSDDITELVPELAGLRVLRSIDSPVDDTVPAARPITLRDVFTNTLGTGFVFAEPGTYPIQKAFQTAGLELGLGEKPDAEEFLRRLASVPLVHQPGEVWMYNTGSDLLGILVARAAKQSFGDFLRERIFEPLGMRDSGFWVPPEKIARLPKAYVPNLQDGGLKLEDEGAGGIFSSPPAFESGAGGLAATVDDFHMFARMLLDGGAYEGGRILSRSTAEAMTSDQLTDEIKARSPWTPGWFATHGWGYGVGVVTATDHSIDLALSPFDPKFRTEAAASAAGAYGWSGGYGTTWRNDPAKDLVAVLMTQVGMVSAEGPTFFREFLDLAYAAIDD
jgi:CubicO group peptidase (beta-lactamase class C family)